MRPTRDRTGRSSALAAGRDHRYGARAGEAGADDRLVVPGAAVRGLDFKDIVEVNTNSALSARRTTRFLLERSR